MHGFMKVVKDLFSNISVVIFIVIALLTLIIDGYKYNKKNYDREYKIVKFISYSYIAFGIVIFALLILD